MPILTYIKLAAAGLVVALVIGVVIWVQSLRADLAQAHADMATRDATINEMSLAQTANLAAIARMEAANKLTQTAIIDDAQKAQATSATVTVWKEKVRNVPIPPNQKTCDAFVSPRDLALLDGLRDTLQPASGGADANGPHSDPGSPNGGHSPAAHSGDLPNPR